MELLLCQQQPLQAASHDKDRGPELAQWKGITEEGQLTSSPTLMALPPHPGNKTRSPTVTLTGVITPSLFGAPGPTAMTVASGRGDWVAEEGRKRPVAVFYRVIHTRRPPKEVRGLTVSALKRCTRTRSRRGWRDLMFLKVAACRVNNLSTKFRICSGKWSGEV